MAKKKVVTIHGVGNVVTKLKKLADVSPEGTTKGLLAGGEVIAKEARRLAPVDTGRLRDSIEAIRIQDNLVVVEADTEYADFVEFGTVKMDAQPYMRPAFDNKARSARQTMIAVLRKEIQKAAK